MRVAGARSLAPAAPNLTPALLLAAFVTVYFFTSDGLQWVGAALVGMVVIPAALYWFSTNTAVALGALILASAMPRFYLPLGSMKARPEHIVGALLCVAAVWIYRRSRVSSPWIFADALLIVYLALNILSSTFRSVEPAQTFKWALQQVLVAAAYFFIRLFAGDADRFRLAVRVMLAAAMFEGLYAAACFFSGRIWRTEFGLEPGQYDNVSAVYGTQFEANLLGSYCAACLVMMVAMYFHSSDRKYLWGIASTYMGMLIALSRAAIIAGAAGLCALWIYAVVAKTAKRGTPIKVVGILLLVTLLLATSLVPLYVERFSTLQSGNLAADDNTKVRLLVMPMALSQIIESPILGTGTSSFQLMFEFKEIGYDYTEEAGWIGNTEIRILHDTGVVGLLVFGWFVFYLVIRGIRIVRRTRNPELAGLLLSSIVYFLAFQATEGTLLAFSWVHLGLLGTGIAIYANSNQESKAVQVAAH